MMLEVKDLVIRFHDRIGGEAVHGVNFTMDAGERLGIVGESGAGKTLTALAITRLLAQDTTEILGKITFQGIDMLAANNKEMREIRGKDIGFIFQDPVASLNPLIPVGPQIEEPLLLHTDLSKEERRARVLQAIKDVDLPEPEGTIRKYPHQLSGGQCQRVMIASALICHPALLIADEPTTALDVTVQTQILKLLKKKNRDENVGILYISHDLSLVRRLCTRVIVMYNGSIVETGDVERVFTHPREEYTQRLIAAIPTRNKRYV
ncbi:MAG: ABC transporter ATP-binding protein [Anaerolineaceae bacterium]|nr:ABC transporter ATP-binding protein [Anaerolineaceae bacterium]